MLRTSGLDVITHESLDYEYLGDKGLHLTNRGVTLLAKNMIAFIKRL